LSGLVDKIDDPSCSVMAGAVLWITKEGNQVETTTVKKNSIEMKGLGSILKTIKKWFVDLLPGG